MSASSTRCIPGLIGLSICSLSVSNAQIECWAPGMASSVTLTSASGSKSVSLGKPYRYDVYGVAGTLELGSQARDTVVINGQFRQKYLIGTGGVVSSTGYAMLQTGLLNIYPQQLTIKADSPGSFVGPVLNYGPNWTLSDPRNPATVNLTFHQSGSSLLGALLPGLLEPSFSNQNPKGNFYVLGEYHAAPPVMTGSLSISADTVLNECPVAFSYSIERNENATYRPPLLGVILQSTNLTILGTPPASATPPSGQGGVQVAVSIDPSQVQISIDLNATQGTGWKKTSVSP